jgi:DNA-binding NarL/FixJ family response regulator
MDRKTLPGMISRDDYQRAAQLGVSEEAVKTRIQFVLVKLNLHGKSELRMQLGRRDLSQWSPEAQD